MSQNVMKSESWNRLLWSTQYPDAVFFRQSVPGIFAQSDRWEQSDKSRNKLIFMQNVKRARLARRDNKSRVN